MASAAVLRQRLRPLPALILCARSMGGGPRTFPGGVSKWQYKRMHEKFARDKERRLLREEKQLYLTRLRSEIRAGEANGPHPSPSPSPSPSQFGPMTSKEHVKALADRFMKEGAEDLWNDDDGPIRTPTVERSPPKASGIDHCFHPRASLATFHQRRQYSAVAPPRSLHHMRSKPKRRRNSSSEDEQEEELDMRFQEKIGFRVPRFNRDSRDSREERFNRDSREERFNRDSRDSREERFKRDWRDSREERFNRDSRDSWKEGNMVEGSRFEARKKMMSSAALMNHDLPKTRRVPKLDMEEMDLSDCIREEYRRKALSKGDDSEKNFEMEGESLFSGMR